MYAAYGRVDYFFDLYRQTSVKATERLRRSKEVGIKMSSISTITPLPKDMKSFWSSTSNKVNLQKYVYSVVKSSG